MIAPRPSRTPLVGRLHPTVGRTHAVAHLLAGLLLVALAVPAHAQEGIRREVKKAPKPKLTKPPRLIGFVNAVYPKAARDAGISGKVELQVDIDATGAVIDATVLVDPGAGLGAAAAAAARKFRFTPAEIDNVPAPVRIRYNYNFALEERWVPEVPNWALDPNAIPVGKFALVGRVREQGTRLPVPGAAVAVMTAGVEVKADPRGKFSVASLPPGKHRVQAISLEHKRQTVEVEIVAGEQTKIDFYLPPLNTSDYEVVVRGKRRRTTVTRISLRRREMLTVPGTFGDPVRVVENLPGIARTPYIGGGLLVRGAAPQDSGVFLDGVKIPVIYHLFGGPSVLNPQFLERIDYYPGNADPRYGRLTAGVIDVGTRNTFTKQWQGSADLNLIWSGAFLNIPVHDKVSVAIAGRRSYIDAILPTVLEIAGASATSVVPVFYDYQLRADVDLAGDDSLWVLAFGSHDEFSIVSNERDQDLQVDLSTRITFHRVHSQWRTQITPSLSSKLSPTFGFNIINFGSAQTNFDIESFVFGVREDLDWVVNKKVRVRFGLDAEVRRASFSGDLPLPVNFRNPANPTSGGQGQGFLNQLSTDTSEVTIRQWLGGVGAYVYGILDVTDRVQLLPGVRFETMFFFGNARPAVDPRLTARIAVNPRTTIKGGLGMYSQAPQPSQANDTIGNPDLLLERAAHFSLGLERQIIENLKLDVQVYYLHRYDSVVFTNEVDFKPNNPVPLQLRFTNEGDGFSYGLEVLLKHDVTRYFYGWLSYTLSLSKERLRPNEPLVPFVFDQTHLLTLVGSFRLGDGWETGLRFRLATGRPETPIKHGLFDADGGFFARINGPLRTSRRQTFHQLDLRVEKTWIWDLWRLSVYLDVQNVYNAPNPEATLYDYCFCEDGVLPGLPILPTLGVRGSF